MRIKITTIREFPDCDFENYINELEKGHIRVDKEKFRKKGKFTYLDDYGYTKAITTYKILLEKHNDCISKSKKWSGKN